MIYAFSLVTSTGCSRGRVTRVIVSAYNVLQNIDVTSRILMCEIMSYSLLQCSVETLNGGFDIWIAHYPKTNVVFFKKFLLIARQIFDPCPFISIRVLVLRFSLIRVEKLLSRSYSFCYEIFHNNIGIMVMGMWCRCLCEIVKNTFVCLIIPWYCLLHFRFSWVRFSAFLG